MVEQPYVTSPRDCTPLVAASPAGNKYYTSSFHYETTPVTTQRHSKWRPDVIGLLLGLLAGVLQALAQTLVHFAFSSSVAFPIFIPMVVVGFIFIWSSSISIKLFNIPTINTLSRHLKLILFLRCILGGFLYAASLITLRNLPAPIAVTIFATAPSIASFFSALFLNTSIGPRDILILAANIIGVCLVANPTHHNPAQGGIPLTKKGVIIGIVNAFLIGASFTAAKALGKKVDASLHILAMGVGAMILSPLVFSKRETAVAMSQPVLVGLVVFAECFECLSQYIMAYAVKFCHPGKLLVMRSVNVPMVCLLSFFIVRESLGVSQLFGVAVVLLSIAYNGMNSN